MSDNQEENNTNEQEVKLANAEGSTSEEVQEIVTQIQQDFSNESVPLESTLFGDTQPQQPENPLSAMEQLIKNNADTENNNPDTETPAPSNEADQTEDNQPKEEQNVEDNQPQEQNAVDKVENAETQQPEPVQPIQVVVEPENETEQVNQIANNTVDKVENAETQQPEPVQPIQVVVEPENETEQVNQIANNTENPIQIATQQNEDTFNPPIEVINNFNNQNNHPIPEKQKPATFKQALLDSYHELEEKAGKEEAAHVVKQFIRNVVLFAAGSYFVSTLAQFIDDLK